MIRALALVLGLAGCSDMYLRTPDLTLHCSAFGQGTSEVCAPVRVGDLGPEPPVCIRCSGGPISFAEALFGALGAWIMAGMPLGG